ncbi:ARM repeat-containing protein [Anaeromyces robustus]|uniref:ARM repeat-containing protein n=1 Tax=Anaeromyces robustus TaxID=1754192 RepID=A0A1Y1XIG4_9FUNG|nr:ARM repeat-containing protein [Anaeromyces robustus]|eukprot:ORX85545.1 ARM repeat-containing protein [Anaeromyces robustus]
MGNIISCQFKWSQENKSELVKCVENYDLLQNLLSILDNICNNYPEESRTEFKKMIRWRTIHITPSIFTDSSNYIINKDTTKSSILVQSLQHQKNGSPLFTLENDVTSESSDENSSYIARASTLEQIHTILNMVNDKKLIELQNMVKENKDFYSYVTGISGNNQINDIWDTNKSNMNEDEETKKRFKLLLILNACDNNMLRNLLETNVKNETVTMNKIESELLMIQSFCGKEDCYALESIEWESDYKFANGCRATPWRQIYNELGYIKVLPKDKEKIIITACINGFFINKGYITNDKGVENIDYEAKSSVYPSLINLLKDYSPHFCEKIQNQEYVYVNNSNPQKEDEIKEIVPQPKSESTLETPTFIEEKRKEVENVQNVPQHKTEPKKKVTTKKTKGKSGSASKKLDYNSKWRTLNTKSTEVGNRSKEITRTRPKKKVASSSKSLKEIQRKASSNLSEWTSDSESEVSSEEETQENRQETSELPSEYWQIQKLVKYLRCGNPTATVIAICSLRDFDLLNETNQLAIRDVGGLDTLVNLLDTEDSKCKIGALKILQLISQNIQIRNAIADLDGMKTLVDLLGDSNEELKCLAAETIANCAKNSRNRAAVRHYKGIRKLVRLLKVTPGSKEERVAICGAMALSSLSKSAKNKVAIQNAGAIPLLANLLESKNEQLLIPVVEILKECASSESYRLAIQNSGIIKFLVENLSSESEELQTNCASAIFKCAENEEARDFVRVHGGLAPLVNLLNKKDNKELLVAATGAIWKCSQNLENVKEFNKLNTIRKLVELLENQPEDVLINVAGALGACAQTVDGRESIRCSGGITPLVGLLTGTNQALLVNVTTAVGACALDSESMSVIDKLDGVRLLWSLLKSPNHHVQASAAWAICPCIEHAKDAGEMVRSFVGGLELIVSLLKSEHVQVLASVCASIANIAKDEENLAVITDHGVVPMLAKLTNTKNDKLRRHLAEAIARCCRWGNNKVAFGSAGAVAPLVKYLKSPDEQVHKSTAHALHQLSMDSNNCITMHEHGVVQLLLGMVGSSDPALQEAAAGTIGNIRRLALASEKAAMA